MPDQWRRESTHRDREFSSGGGGGGDNDGGNVIAVGDGARTIRALIRFFVRMTFDTVTALVADAMCGPFEDAGATPIDMAEFLFGTDGRTEDVRATVLASLRALDGVILRSVGSDATASTGATGGGAAVAVAALERCRFVVEYRRGVTVATARLLRTVALLCATPPSGNSRGDAAAAAVTEPPLLRCVRCRTATAATRLRALTKCPTCGLDVVRATVMACKSAVDACCADGVYHRPNAGDCAALPAALMADPHCLQQCLWVLHATAEPLLCVSGDACVPSADAFRTRQEFAAMASHGMRVDVHAASRLSSRNIRVTVATLPELEAARAEEGVRRLEKRGLLPPWLQQQKGPRGDVESVPSLSALRAEAGRLRAIADAAARSVTPAGLPLATLAVRRLCAVGLCVPIEGTVADEAEEAGDEEDEGEWQTIQLPS